MAASIPNTGGGALPTHHIAQMCTDGAITGTEQSRIRPASLDLAISDEVYRVNRLFLPGTDETVRGLLERIGSQPHDPHAPMEVGVVYLARLQERVQLPDGVYAYCNPKSTTGRNDLHVRVLADGISCYDDVAAPGWHGELWVAIVPRSYPVIIEPGTSLSQMRFFTGDTRMNEAEVAACCDEQRLLWQPDGTPITYEELAATTNDGSLTLTLGLDTDIAGYECREPNVPLDLANVGGYDPADFFTPIYARDGAVTLREGRFYILSTREYVRVPNTHACEMRPMSERYGDFRAHYAGFIDPGWGWGADGEGRGRPLTLEVRPFEYLEVRHGQPIALVRFEQMQEAPEVAYDAMQSNYLRQTGPALAKQFKHV